MSTSENKSTEAQKRADELLQVFEKDADGIQRLVQFLGRGLTSKNTTLVQVPLWYIELLNELLSDSKVQVKRV